MKLAYKESMATIFESMELLKTIIARGDMDDRQRYLYGIEWIAFSEILRGDPYDESRWNHADERYTYRAARERAALQRQLQG